MKSIIGTIKDMHKSMLCTGCGTCAGVCPNKAITMELTEKGFYKPNLTESKCNSCGLCIKCCPALERLENNSAKQKVNSCKYSFHKLIGCYHNIYIGYSTDNDLRKNCSSGGIVTSLLLYLLENEIVDYAVVADQNKGGIYGFGPKIVTTKSEIIEASGSKYIPLPQSSSLAKILELDGTFAFVGLPCHIQGVIKSMRRIPILRRKIKFTISLFCGGTTSVNATKYLLHLFKLAEQDVKSIRYRGGGWPGNFSIKKEDKTEIRIPYTDIRAMGGVYSSPLYRPFFCTLCDDPFGRSSDISTGDAWHKKFKKDSLGSNIIITRNRKVDKIMGDMVKRGYLVLEKVDVGDVLSSNPSLVDAKYKNLYLKYQSFQKIYPYELTKNKPAYRGDSNTINKISVMLFMMIKKYLECFDQKRVISSFPLSGFKFLKIINLLERGRLK